MNARVKRIVDEVRELPPSERRLVRDLLDEPETSVEAEEVSRAWGKELTSRIEDIDSGRVKLVPAEAMIARARAYVRTTQ
jgi:putative addiction module component (TIGR02574 family)